MLGGTVECPTCHVLVTVPRIQINDATDGRAPVRPRRDSFRDKDTTPKSPRRCPECEADFGVCPYMLDGTVKCPDCETLIVVPRIQINDAVDTRAPRKPFRRATGDGPPRLPVRCDDCDGFMTWSRQSAMSADALSPGNKPGDRFFQMNLLASETSECEDWSIGLKRVSFLELGQYASSGEYDLFSAPLDKTENSSIILLQTALRSCQIEKRDYFWETPEWVKHRHLLRRISSGGQYLSPRKDQRRANTFVPEWVKNRNLRSGSLNRRPAEYRLS